MEVLGKGEFEEAISQYRTAIKNKPDYFLANYNLGKTLMAKGEIDEVIIYYKTAIKIEPAFDLTHKNLRAALLIK